jgi:hypothetical protein
MPAAVSSFMIVMPSSLPGKKPSEEAAPDCRQAGLLHAPLVLDLRGMEL